MGVAKFAAVKAVKQQLRDQGLRPVHIERAVIVTAANAYLDKHRDELLAEATETVRNFAGFRTLAEREARERRRNQRDRDSANNSKPNTTPQAERGVSATRVSDRGGSRAFDRCLAKARQEWRQRLLRDLVELQARPKGKRTGSAPMGSDRPPPGTPTRQSS
jgi:hypothetical protein